ncbi:MAG: tandem-95 repeat protein [Planctomycetaceae bacterium]|nr:MAG: tandem-95 repeat protein [Planctomycetaceae bacterium]
MRGRDRGRRAHMIFESLENRSLLAGDLLQALALSDFDSPAGPAEQLTFQASTGPVSTVSMGEATWSGAEGEWGPEGEDAPDLVAFAKALTDAGVKMYSAAWCTFCTMQKQLFQDGGSYLPFIEVTNPDRTLNEIGSENNITSFPTWEFPDQTREAGLLNLQTISERSGVPIPTSSTPYLKPIEDQTLLATSPLHIALDGYDPKGGPLTYTVSSDNDQVEATLLQGNRSMRIEVAEYGDMVFQLFEQRAPRPAGRVIELAESNFYDNILFHRVIDGFVIQGGDPTGTGSGGSTLGTFDDQYHVDLQHNRAGLLSFAKSSDDTNDSQFFVTLAPTRHLDFNHSIFGILVEGRDVLQAIGSTATGNGDRPVYDIRMNTIEIFEDTENAVMMLKADPEAIGQQANITVTVDDGLGNQTQQDFVVTVAEDPFNSGPFLEDLPDFETTVGTPLQIQLSAIDVEGDPVFFDAAAAGSVDSTVEVNSETGLVTVTPPAGYIGPMEILVGVQALTGSDRSDPWDTQIVNINVVGEQLELALELLPESDSNIVGDNVTNITELTFRVSNTIVGGQVQILYDNAVIGQGTATGTSIDITTDNLATLGDGEYSLIAVQTVDGVAGDPSNVLTVTLDTTPPVPLTSTPPTTATNGIELVYDAQHPEEGTPGFEYSLVDPPQGATIDSTTGVLRWTPSIGQGGLNTFQILVMDLAGNTQTQDLAIDVTVEQQLVTIELVVVDQQENPVSTLAAGEEFWVMAYVEDMRVPAEGVFAAYVDVRYDPTLVTNLATSLSDVVFGDLYQNGVSGIFTTPGLLDEIGAFGPMSPVGGGKKMLFAVPFRAEEGGQTTFVLEPSDSVGREVLAFGRNEPVPWNAITFVDAPLNVESGLMAVDDLFNVDEDSINFPLDVLQNDENETGLPVEIIQVGLTSEGGTATISADGQQILYTPLPNFFGEETFTYTIAAGDLTSTASVTVQVAPVNDPPTAVDDEFSVGLNSANNFLDVLANDHFDPDVDEVLRIVSVGSTSHGGTVVIAPNGTHLLYTPATGFSGVETFTYTIRDRAVTDPTGLEDTATVRISVDTAPRPTAVNDTATVDEDSVDNAIFVLENDSPAEPGAALTVVAVSDSKFGGTVTIASDGTHVLYTPFPDFFGEDTFTYTVEEEDGGRATASVTVTVLNVNDPPTANDDIYQVSKGAGTRTLNVLENDTIFPDVDEVLTIIAVTQGSQGGTVEIAADGQSILYTQSDDPNLPDTYTETFTYTIDDGSGADNSTDTATVTINIRPFTTRDLGGTVTYAQWQTGIGGATLRLTGMDQFNGEVTLHSYSAANGRYLFDDLAPGSYQIEMQSVPFLLNSDNVLTVDSSDEDGDNLNLNFDSATRDPASISIADFLARAPGQSSLSPSNSVLVAAETGNHQHWYAYEAGWQDFTDLEVELSDDAKTLTIRTVANNGQHYQGTVMLDEVTYVKHLANSGDSHLLRIDAGPEQMGLQPVGTVPVVTVTPLTTTSATPEITGTVSNGTLEVTVSDQTYAAGDGDLQVTGTDWILQIPPSDALQVGTYTVNAMATDAEGNVGMAGTTNQLVILAEESGAEGEAMDWVWSDDDFLDQIQDASLPESNPSDDGYAQAVDLLLALDAAA